MMKMLALASLLFFLSCAPMKKNSINPNGVQLSNDELEIAGVVMGAALDEVSKQFNLAVLGACYIEMPNNADPSSVFLSSRPFPVALHPASQCKISGQFNEVTDRKSHKKGVLVTLGEILIADDGTAKSGFGWHRNSLSGRWFDVTLNKVEGRWVISDIQCTFMS